MSFASENNKFGNNLISPERRGRPKGSPNKPKPEPIESDSPVAAEQLKQFVERVEHLEEEKKALSDDIKEVFAEMKGMGFDTKVVRQIIRIRKMDYSERMEMEAILSLYLSALKMA